MNPTSRPKTLSRRFFTAALLAVATLAVLSPPPARPAGPGIWAGGDRATADVVTTLVGDHPAHALAELPGGFTATMGYTPVVEQMADGRYPANPTGSCSSPVPLPRRFESLCRTHDLGYDLLRYAQRTGHPLGGWARTELDEMLIRRMVASCGDEACVTSARVAQVALALNTWRQYDGPPSSGESTADVVTGIVARGVELVAGRR